MTRKNFNPQRRAEQCKRLIRVHKANNLIDTIAKTGRRFFWSNKHARSGRLELDERWRVWFVDAHSGKRIYTHASGGRWRGFSEGGTLRSLVCDLRDYIQGKPYRLSLMYPTWYSDGDPWGYGDDMQKVRDEADRLGIKYRKEEVKEATT